MDLNLDENYNSTTKLSQWWTQVKGNFSAVRTALTQEETERKQGDANALASVAAEQLNREKDVAREKEDRINGDNELRKRLNNIHLDIVVAEDNAENAVRDEEAARSAADRVLEEKLLAMGHAADSDAIMRLRMSDKTDMSRFMSLNDIELDTPFVLIADEPYLNRTENIAGESKQSLVYNDEIGYIVSGPKIKWGGSYLCILKKHCVSGADPENGALEILAVLDGIRIINCNNTDVIGLVLENGCAYRFGTVTGLHIELPEAELGNSDSYVSYLGFDSGASAAELDYPDTDFVFSGADCYSGYFVPQPNMHYDIEFNFNGSNVIGTVTGHAINVQAADVGKAEPVPLRALPVGAKVKLGRYKATDSAAATELKWTIADKQRSGKFVTLACDNNLNIKGFDAAEPDNPDTSKQNGNNRYKLSNARQWLNSDGAANEWYSAQHEYDAPPLYVGQNGFLRAFTDAERACIAETEHKLRVDDNGATELVQDKVWMPSLYELNFGKRDYLLLERYPDTQEPFEFFKGFNERIWCNTYWLTRSLNYVNICYVAPSGNTTDNMLSQPPNNNSLMIRPFVNLKSNVLFIYDAAAQAYVPAE